MARVDIYGNVVILRRSATALRDAVISAAVSLALVLATLALVPMAAHADPTLRQEYNITTQAKPYDGITTLDAWGDDANATYETPFPIILFGKSYTTAWVNTNGIISFDDPQQAITADEIAALPNTAKPNAALYVFGDDLIVGPGSVIRTAVSGEAPSRRLVIDWHDVTLKDEPDANFSAEAAIGEDGSVEFNYTGLGEDDRRRGSQAVVGLENEDGTAATQAVYHQPTLRDNTAITFLPQESATEPYVISTTAKPYDGFSSMNLTGDDEYSQLDLPFPIDFFGQSYDSLFVDTNGSASVVDPHGSVSRPDHIPSSNAPNGTVFAFGDDLVVDYGSTIRYAVTGTEPARQFTVEWHNVRRYSDEGGRFSTEVTFGEDGTISVQYSGLSDQNDYGSGAIVGIENAAGTQGSEVAHDQAPLQNDLMYTFHAPSYSLATGSAAFDGLSTLDLAGSDGYVPLSLPFPVPLFGVPHSTAWVDVNGQIAFADPGQSLPPDPPSLPHSAGGPPIVYVFGDDLLMGPGSVVRTALSGTAPSRRFLIEWHNISLASDPTATFNVEASFFESGTVTLNYQGLADETRQGADALVGIDSGDGLHATEASYHTPDLADSLALTFTPQGSTYMLTRRSLAYDGFTSIDIRGEDSHAALELPFVFPFFGKLYREAWVDTSGRVSFVQPGDPYTDGPLAALPSLAAPNAVAYVFGAPIMVGPGAIVRTAELGAPGTRRLLVEWHNVALASEPTVRFSFEASFSENGDIAFNYEGLQTPAQRGAESVVGLESATGKAAVQVAYHNAILDNDQAQMFTATGYSIQNEMTITGNEGLSVDVQTAEPINAHQVHVTTDLQASLVSAKDQVSLAYDFKLDEGLTLRQAKITIPYDPRRLQQQNLRSGDQTEVDPSHLEVFYFDRTYGLWRWMDTENTVDTVTHTVTTVVPHFSTYALFRDDVEAKWTSQLNSPDRLAPCASGVDVQFAIDQSAGTATYDEAGMRVDAAKQFVDHLKTAPHARAAVSGFDYYGPYYKTAPGSGDTAGLVPLDNAAGLSAVNAALDNSRAVRPDNLYTWPMFPVPPTIYNTKVDNAMWAAESTFWWNNSHLEDPNRKIVIVFTGTQNSSLDMAVPPPINDNNFYFSVYIVGIGPASDPGALADFAEATGGRYLHIDNASDISQIYDAIPTGDEIDSGLDSDGDGLTDCVEVHGALSTRGFYSDDPTASLIRTDPHNPDTDGDGISDGAEMGPELDIDNDWYYSWLYSQMKQRGFHRVWNPRSDPRTPDTDADGLSDHDELLYGTDAYNPDTDGDRVNDGREVALGLDPLEPDDFELAGSAGGWPDLAADTVLEPDNNLLPTIDGHIVEWSHSTHLCLVECQEIRDWSDAQYHGAVGNDAPGLPQEIYCYLYSCTPEDFERGFVVDVVNDQHIFNDDGTLTLDFVTDDLTEACWDAKAVPSSDCVNDQIVNEASNIQYFGQIDTPDEMDDLLNELPGGKAPVLTEEELAAKTRMEELARQACSETPVGNLTAQEWGRAVHSRLEQLIDAERLTNEKFFGEVGYLNGDVINGPVTGTKWPLGSSRPDAGFGLDKSQPQLLFDLKTGVKGLVAKWLSRLSINLPKGFEGTPVFKLTC